MLVLIATQSPYRLAETRKHDHGKYTIRNLDDEVKVRLILREAVGRKPGSGNLASVIRSHFGPSNGVDLELPPREPAREPPSFE